MSVVLLCMTDGRRNCIEQAIPSLERNLHGVIGRRIIHDDSADPYYQAWLHEQFPEYEIARTPFRSGFGGAYANAWDYLTRPAPRDDCRFVLSTEDDFVVERTVPLLTMSRVLNENPHIAQLVLRRQPWNDSERAAGGIVEQHPDAYTEVRADFAPGVAWLEHRLFWSTNTSLHRRSMCWRGWPNVPQSEGVFSRQLVNDDPDLRFAFWGARDSGEWVTHIGTERTGCGY